MKLNQKGFGAVEAILTMVIIGLIGGTGWYVWNAKNSTEDTLKPNNSSLPKKDKAPVSSKPVFNKLPDGFAEYKVDEFGFRMGYPAEAGTMTDARKDGVLFVAITPEGYNAENKWQGYFSLNIYAKLDFTFKTAKYGVTIKPEGGKWIVTEVNPAVTDYKPGDTYKMPEKKINGGVAYEFTDNEEDYPTTRWLIELNKGYAFVSLPRLTTTNISDDVTAANRSAYTKLAGDVLASFTKF